MLQWITWMVDSIAALNMEVKIKDTKFSRDLTNMAVLCNDPAEVRKYKQEMEKRRQIHNVNAEINNLKSDVAEIKSLLNKILERI